MSSVILENTSTVKVGNLSQIEQTYREDPGSLAPQERFVLEAGHAQSMHEAIRVIRKGEANGWRFHVGRRGVVSLWAPTMWKPVTYTFENTVLWKTVVAHKAITGGS